jgi:hypothetical protein
MPSRTCVICGKKLTKKSVCFPAFDRAQTRAFCLEDIHAFIGYYMATLQYDHKYRKSIPILQYDHKPKSMVINDCFEILDNFIEVTKAIKSKKPIPKLPKKEKMQST